MRTRMVALWEADLFRSVVFSALEPILEEWSGIKLRASEAYGIRRYGRGAWLMLHVDRLNTHVVSAILQVLRVIAIYLRT